MFLSFKTVALTTRERLFTKLLLDLLFNISKIQHIQDAELGKMLNSKENSVWSRLQSVPGICTLVRAEA